MLAESLYEFVYPYLWCLCVCRLDEDIRDLHTVPHRVLDGSEDNMVSSDIASGRALMQAFLLLYVCKQKWALECGNT